METKRRPVYAMITATTDLPDYYTDETVLRTMTYQSNPGTILINTSTGSIKIRKPGKEKALQYIANYRNDSNLGIAQPLMANIFKIISGQFNQKSTIFAESIFDFGNTSGEALNAYIQILKNPDIDMKFFKTGWLDSNVIRNYISMIDDSSTGISFLGELINTTFESHTSSPENQHEEKKYQGIRRKTSDSKKKSTRTSEKV